MENKVILSVYEKALDGMNIETVFDIVNLYGNKDIDGIELNSNNLKKIKKCATLCKKNGLLFRCHFPLVKLTESKIIKHLNGVSNIAKELRYDINIVVHTLADEGSMIDNITQSQKYFEKILAYVEKYKLHVIISAENLNFIGGIRRINVKEIDEILKINDNLKFTYDIGHDLYDNKNPSVLSSLQKERINNVHIHSVIKNEDHHVIQENSKDLDEIMKAIKQLKDIGYTGPIVLEYAIKYLEGKRTEEKVINFVKSFYFFKNKVLKSV